MRIYELSVHATKIKQHEFIVLCMSFSMHHPTSLFFSHSLNVICFARVVVSFIALFLRPLVWCDGWEVKTLSLLCQLYVSLSGPITCDKLEHFACRHSLTFMQCQLFAFSIPSPDWISPSRGQDSCERKVFCMKCLVLSHGILTIHPSLLSTGSKHSQQNQRKKKSLKFLCKFLHVCMFSQLLEASTLYIVQIS